MGRPLSLSPLTPTPTGPCCARPLTHCWGLTSQTGAEEWISPDKLWGPASSRSRLAAGVSLVRFPVGGGGGTETRSGRLDHWVGGWRRTVLGSCVQGGSEDAEQEDQDGVNSG